MAPLHGTVVTTGPVVVVGGSLAGMASAARLAKAGHQVVLLEQSDRLGGRWADTAAGDPGALPPVLAFPAPWRDLFRKTGRPLDAELARAGLTLEPAPAAIHIFADGARLALPDERGAQWAAISAVHGPAVASRWRDVLDDLDGRWQVLRHLGLEDEAPDSALSPRVRAQLDARTSVADLARQAGHPHLAALLRSAAWRGGAPPERTPGWVAVRLAVERGFGRWILNREGEQVSAQGLLDLLVRRLELRGVQLRLNARVDGLGAGRVELDGGPLPAAAVIWSARPDAFLRLAGTGERRIARRLRWTRPALAPVVSTRFDGERWTGEVVRHTAAGPIVEYGLHHPDGTQVIVHDHSRPAPDPGYGIAWDGWRTWRALPPLRAATPRTFLAGASSRGGNDPWAQVLSGAIAGYAVHEELTGADLRPANRNLTAD